MSNLLARLMEPTGLEFHETAVDVVVLFDQWQPASVPALFVEIAKPGEIDDWKQPTGAHDAYNKGDKVKHGGYVWTSDIDGNIWEPGVHGWTKAD